MNMAMKAIFEGLVFDENENPADVRNIGDEAFYVVDDDGFMRHIPAEDVDRQIIEQLKKQFDENKEAIIEQSAKLLGIEDPFSQAAMASKLGDFDQQYDLLKMVGIPENDRMFLGMAGFKVIIDIHGNLVEFHQPSQPEEE
jgi:hypothetical protein